MKRNIKKWLLTASADAVYVDFSTILYSENEPNYWTCEHIASANGCDYWTIEEL